MEYTIWCAGQEGDGEHCTRCAESIYGLRCVNLRGDALHWGCASSLLAAVGVANVPQRRWRGASPRRVTAFRGELERKLALAVRSARQRMKSAETSSLQPAAPCVYTNDGTDEAEVDRRFVRGRTCGRRPHRHVEARREMEMAGVVGVAPGLSRRSAVSTEDAHRNTRTSKVGCEPQYRRRGIAHRGYQLQRRLERGGRKNTPTTKLSPSRVEADDFSCDSGNYISTVSRWDLVASMLCFLIMLSCALMTQLRLRGERSAIELRRGLFAPSVHAKLRNSWIPARSPTTLWRLLRASCKFMLLGAMLTQTFAGNPLASIGTILHVLGWHAATAMRCRALTMCLMVGISSGYLNIFLAVVLSSVAPMFPPADDALDYEDGTGARNDNDSMPLPGFTQQSVHWWHGPPVLQQQPSLKLIGAVKPIRSSGFIMHERIMALHEQPHRKIDTDGNGACAIHSVFGQPTMSVSSRLFVTAAREKAVCTLGSSAAVFRRRLQTPKFYDSITSALWLDLLLPVLYRVCGISTVLEERTQGRILWSRVIRDAALQEDLMAHVGVEASKRQTSDDFRTDAAARFGSACSKEDDGLWSLVREETNADALVWDPDALPWFELGGRRLVKGTQVEIPSDDPPESMSEALLDDRPCFNAVRRGYMECLGGNLRGFQHALEHVLTRLQPDLLHHRCIQQLLQMFTATCPRQRISWIVYGHIT